MQDLHSRDFPGHFQAHKEAYGNMGWVWTRQAAKRYKGLYKAMGFGFFSLFASVLQQNILILFALFG